jgi:hypothetical protein
MPTPMPSPMPTTAPCRSRRTTACARGVPRRTLCAKPLAPARPRAPTARTTPPSPAGKPSAAAATVAVALALALAAAAGAPLPAQVAGAPSPSRRGGEAAPAAQPGRPALRVDTAALRGALEYRCVGPTRGGRATAVAGVAQHPGHFYMGATGGGVWKTTDYGATWHNVSDGFFASGSIGAIRAAPSDPDVVYVGTGSDGLRSNVISGCGVYKSTDAGATWVHAGLRATRHIGAVEVDPSDPDVVYVAAIGDAFQPTPERGVYRSLDGGVTWQKLLFLADQVGAVD